MDYKNTVIDKKGNALEGCVVRLYKTGEVNILQEVLTNNIGMFVFLGVITGRYDIKVWYNGSEKSFIEKVDIVDAIEVGGAGYTLKPVQNITELKAIDITSVGDKSQCLVEDENIIYRYDAESVLAEDLPYIVMPGSSPVSGRWMRLPSATHHSDLIDDQVGKHRLINDGGTSAIELFSANKINTELGIKADLDSNGKFVPIQAASYQFDNYLEFVNLGTFPVTGSGGITYIALDTYKVYKWSGAQYIEIFPAIGEIFRIGEDTFIVDVTRGNKILSVDTIAFSGGEDSLNVTNRFIEGEHGIPMNLVGFPLPWDATIVYAMVSGGSNTQTWAAQIWKNSDVAATVSWTISNTYNIIVYANTDFSEGDILKLYCSGASIDIPVIRIFIKRRKA